MKGMDDELDKHPLSINPGDIKALERPISRQEGNVTEPGEQALTDSLRSTFELLKRAKGDQQFALKNQLRTLGNQIMEVNMTPIERKNAKAIQTALSASWLVAIIGTLGFIIAFTFLINFPGYIADPITELTHRIREISNRNYKAQLNLGKLDEFDELIEAFNVMTSKLTEYENSNLSKLLFEKKRVETLINSLQEGIIGIDENSYIIFVNHVACGLLGMNEPELMGRYAPDIALFNDLFRNLLKDESNKIKIYSDGKESFYSKDILPVMNEENMIGKVIILKNITEFQQLDEAKTNFIATISHELKTPLSAIKMSLKLLDDHRIGQVNDEQKQLLSNIEDDTRRLMNITTELLDMAQVETGKISLNFGISPPQDLVEYALNAVKSLSEQKEIRFEVQYDKPLGTVRADLDKTTWVITNLLSNAIKYSRTGNSIEIFIRQKEKEIEFSVQDHGKGIEDKYKNRIFERYFKVPGDSFEKSGTGLGLAIAKDFIEAQSGTIGLESEIGFGTRFFFTLPLA